MSPAESGSVGPAADTSDAAAQVYEPPRVTRLGTLAELTLGGTPGIMDGLGGAGDEGSL